MRRITYDIVKEEFDQRGYELISTKYINNSSKLQYICPKHREKGILTITFANFTNGRGCPYCAHRIKKTQEEYEQELMLKKPTIKCVDKYINLKTKIRHKCLVCGNEWLVKPDLMINNKNGCPYCGKRVKLTQAAFIKKVADINPYIEVLGEYIDHKTKIQFACKKCKHHWYANPNNILNGKGCPNCKSSKGELEIIRHLDANGIEYIREYSFADCKYIHTLPFDFYLPNFNICIEYDGLQHFEPCTFGGISVQQATDNLEITHTKDNIKTTYCRDNNIKLIRIPYWEYDNIQNIISSII